ncbi:MAG: hypothetical protein PHG66_04640 [Candidatus Colwellbacteria bacterium]|nr:hypothetical protein [Candidatus Colwellbacteria bacterium]
MSNDYKTIDDFKKKGLSSNKAREAWLEQGQSLAIEENKKKIDKEIDHAKRILLKLDRKEQLEFDDIEYVCRCSKTPIRDAYLFGKGLPMTYMGLTDHLKRMTTSSR